MIKDIAAPITALIVSFLTVILLHPQLVKFALRKDIVNKPNARRLNRIPIPVLGGVGVYAGFTAALCACNAIFNIEISMASFAAITMMLCVGLLDDIKDLSPKTKFIAQILAILILITCCNLKIDNLYGIFGIHKIPDYLSIPLTIFACVGLINAINLIDGIDGLSSGYGIAAATLFCIYGYIHGNHLNTLIAIATIGALIPFFVYNVFGKKNKMFIGDAGSHFLGIIFCLLTLNVIDRNGTANDTAASSGYIPFCLAVMAHPVMDTLRVMTMRICNGNSPFKADKTHLHHAIINTGLSHLKTTLLIIALNLIVVAAWYLTYITGQSATTQLLVTLCVASITIIAPYFILKNIQKSHPELIEKINAKNNSKIKQTA